MINLTPLFEVTSYKIDATHVYVQFKDTTYNSCDVPVLGHNWGSTNAAAILTGGDNEFTTLVFPAAQNYVDISLQLFTDSYAATITGLVYFDGTDLFVYAVGGVPHVINNYMGGIINSKVNVSLLLATGIDPLLGTVFNYNYYKDRTVLLETNNIGEFSILYPEGSYESKVTVDLPLPVQSTITREFVVYYSKEYEENVQLTEMSGVCPVTALTVHTDTLNYIEKLSVETPLDNSKMNVLELVLKENCCTVKELKIPPYYKFQLVESGCSPTGNIVTIDGDQYVEIQTTVQLLGVDPSVIKTLTYISNPVLQTTTTLSAMPQDMKFADILIYFPAGAGPGYVGNFYFEFTNQADFVYRIDYELKAGATCPENDLRNVSISYPAYPEGISLNYYHVTENGVTGAVLEMDASLLNEYSVVHPETAIFPMGVYQVSVRDKSECNDYFTDCYVVDCDIDCLVANALIEECPIEIYYLAEALKAYNTCKGPVSCESICNIYDRFKDLINSCNCEYYNITLPSKTNDCGCS